jgi:hypothetical protein
MGNEKNMLHILRRIEAPKMFEKNGNLRGLYGADFKYIPGIYFFTQHNLYKSMFCIYLW